LSAAEEEVISSSSFLSGGVVVVSVLVLPGVVLKARFLGVVGTVADVIEAKLEDGSVEIGNIVVVPNR
jgi:hypothetical protein